MRGTCGGTFICCTYFTLLFISFMLLMLYLQQGAPSADGPTIKEQHKDTQDKTHVKLHLKSVCNHHLIYCVCCFFGRGVLHVGSNNLCMYVCIKISQAVQLLDFLFYNCVILLGFIVTISLTFFLKTNGS